MALDLLVPRPRLIMPKPTSYVALDMAFALGTGTSLFDKSRRRSHGSISGAQWATGLHGYALDFVPGTPSYVEIPSLYTHLNFMAEDFSIIARAYIDTLTAIRQIFNRGLRSVDGWGFLVHSVGTLEFHTYQSGAWQYSASAGGSVETGAWYTLGASRDGAAVKVYINGVDATIEAGTHVNPATCARSAKIGIYDNKSSYPFDGKIEFLRIFGGIALSASEHLAWHNALA